MYQDIMKKISHMEWRNKLTFIQTLHVGHVNKSTFVQAGIPEEPLIP